MPGTIGPSRPRSGGYDRHSPGLEFDRVAFFSDAVFAIAMTLLVVGIAVPVVDADQLGDALRDLRAEFVSFFVSFVVIGYYWSAHHRFFANLKRVDSGFILINLGYLAAIAFAPFPTALIGKYESEPVSVILYAVTIGVASFLETVEFVYARRRGVLAVVIPDDLYQYGLMASLAPVAVLVASIPIALWSTTAAIIAWLLLFPLERVLERWRPDSMDELRG